MRAQLPYTEDRVFAYRYHPPHPRLDWLHHRRTDLCGQTATQPAGTVPPNSCLLSFHICPFATKTSKKGSYITPEQEGGEACPKSHYQELDTGGVCASWLAYGHMTLKRMILISGSLFMYHTNAPGWGTLVYMKHTGYVSTYGAYRKHPGVH